MEENYIKLIFGLKLKQIRTDKNLSLFGLSKITGLSKSYLNEIEKGKKYPKTDKIILLADKLGVPYDYMVSLKLDKNLAPIGRILRGRILKEIPLEYFGIKESTLIDIIANAPDKVNAFINTIIKIAQDYSFTRESFYLASVRSHQEANNNFFEELETQAMKFAKAYHIDLTQPIHSKELEDILIEEFDYTINKTELDEHQDIDDLRSIYVPKSKTLLISNALDDAQCAFIYAKEIAYNYLNYKERLYTFSWIKFDNFDQVFNNFYASYFAGALLLSKPGLTVRLKEIFEESEFNTESFLQTIDFYNASSETFYQRLTNILPKDFNLLNLFFVRIGHQKGSTDFHIEKELHLINNKSGNSDEANELFCRRWVSVAALSNKSNKFSIKILNHSENNSKYLIFSSTRKDSHIKGQYKSICLGLLYDKQLERKLGFLNHQSLKTIDVKEAIVNKYHIYDSQNRIERPIALEKQPKNIKMEKIVANISRKFSQ